MITQIKLKNFKIFKNETAFPLSKINLLTGINGRGKSSLLQSLLLMKQSIDENEFTDKIYLNGSCVRLGTVEDIKNNTSSVDDDIQLEFAFQDIKTEIQFSLSYTLKIGDTFNNTLFIDLVKMFCSNMLISAPLSKEYRYQAIDFYQSENNKEILIFKSEKETFEFGFSWGFNKLYPYIEENSIPKVANAEYDLVYFQSKDDDTSHLTQYALLRLVNFYRTHYTSADRIGPKDFYSKNNLDSFPIIDKHGEYTINILANKQDMLVNDRLYIGQDSKTLLQQTGEWLSEILDTPNISVLIDDKSNDFVITLKFKIGTAEYKPSNVGFGYSYILPIIVSGLIAEEGEILIVENPEAHLHPKAQSKLTKFLAKVASCGVQLFVETHSEHILNALRIAVKLPEYEINKEDVSALYFHDREDGGYFIQIPIQADGRIEEWPEGFFDQTESDFDIIFGS
jgi:predicted ATPase